MRVVVTEGSTLVLPHDDREYVAGDELDLEDEALEVQLNAGVVAEVRFKAEATEEKGE